ncbi:hypothetical protein L226DRAFT_609206 [Lentinus tigrinus ALCF2SS1-7]|uniref:C3H1-type domain-containing protein n=1 Tax=Lentinus tigrinus ALCF2SS1-6 TaxID=1328759 RepID=A0A5C2ST84_9APHY|nr:hypothetical protein L227DRAFT_649088 [Lentinus tigrinus ALCF2SS1-6]RPD80279.1 hypothetical protein L226DRAFT_609206 [Lentinus tigrinus ALCF2SS1-7]
MAPNVRCRYYDQDTGAPIGLGCPRGSDCFYIHPSSSQWAGARNAKFPYQDRRSSGTGRGGRNAVDSRSSGWSSSSTTTGANRTRPLRQSPIPTAPRAMHAELESTSGWGSAPIGGTTWSTSETSLAMGTTNAVATASTSTSTRDSANDTSWGAPTGGGWGAPTSGGWGEPTAVGGWGTTTTASTSTPPPAPAFSPPPPPIAAPPRAPASAPQQSPTRENPESIIWGDRKGKGREVAGVGTPQYAPFTPRTPRSPNRSPERGDPRRSHAIAPPTMTPTDYVAVASTVSKEMRQEKERMRMISSGIYVPKALAGDGTVASSSKKNPFAFPAYNPPEKMDVERYVKGALSNVDSDPGCSMDLEADAEIPVSLTDQWKDYSRTLSSAICSNIDIRTLQQTRQQVKRLHNSKLIASASQVAAHARLNELDSDAVTQLQQARARYDTAIKHLMRYPLEGLPPPSDNDPRMKDAENVRRHVEDIRNWMAKMNESISELQETIQDVQDAQRRIEEENRQIEEEQKRAAAEAEIEAEKQRAVQKWVPINSTRKAVTEVEERVTSLEERVADLEYDLEYLRETTPSTGDVVLQRLVELGICKSTEPPAGQLERQESLEEGEMPFVPPPPPKSNEELTEECERLGKRLDEYSIVAEHGQQQLKELQERRFTRDRSYHELAGDNARLALTIRTLEKTQQDQADLLAKTGEDIAHLEELLEKYKNDRPPPPPPPPTSDEITAEVVKNVLPELRSMVTRALGRMKIGVDKALLKQQEAVCGQIFMTLQPALVIVQTAKAFMDRQPEVLMPPPPPPVQTQSVQY